MMIEKLKKTAKKLKISDLGIVRAEVFDSLCRDLHNSNTSEFVSAPPEERSNPFLLMPNVKSIIVCLFNYNNPEEGNISKYAMGKDYHLVVKKKLECLSEILQEEGYTCMYFSDSWNMNERFLAVTAGLGFIGKNHMFISKKYGSYVFIGAIMTDCELEPSKPTKDLCIGCNECIKNCPGEALAKDGSFHENLCLSYITQKKGELNQEEEMILKKGGSVWGCDMCQSICPYNQNAPFSIIEEFSNDLITLLDVNENISNKEFKRKYKERAFSWRGKFPILRNQKILRK